MAGFLYLLEAGFAVPGVYAQASCKHREGEKRVSSYVDRAKWLSAHVSYSLSVLLHPRESAQAVQSHLARIQGVFPRENANGVIFFAGNEPFMERFGYNLIWSCYAHARQCGVHVHLYEPSAEILRHLEAMKENFSDLQLSYTYEDDIDFGSLPERGMYYTAFRFVVARKILEESKSLLVCLDADSLIMHSLHQVITNALQRDVGLYFRLKKRRLNKKIAAFCVIFNNTKKSLAFLTFFAGLALKFQQHYPSTRTHFWFDQSALYFSYVLSKLQGRVSFYTIGKRVVDYEFSDKACIWTAKGKRKKAEVFLQESCRIRDQYAAALDAANGHS
ncbi:MAG: hypothetical protein HY268_21175 [Deltaproteobacteria bacterium]|nr:hypothetical protein [Deltaproteobacteria bacterium]